MKHTKGPWFIQKDDEYNRYCIDDTAGTQCEPIAEISFRDFRHPNAQANARLIAAAPELLEALRDVLNGLYALRDNAQLEGSEYGQVEQRLINLGIQAIRKAEGKE